MVETKVRVALGCVIAKNPEIFDFMWAYAPDVTFR